jgi:hypothetical protein
MPPLLRAITHRPPLHESAACVALWQLSFRELRQRQGGNRLAYFDVNDFDEAALGPCAWDLVRFLVCVLLSTPGLSAERKDTIALRHIFLDAHTTSLGEGKARWVEREFRDGMVRHLLDSVGHARITNSSIPALTAREKRDGSASMTVRLFPSRNSGGRGFLRSWRSLPGNGRIRRSSAWLMWLGDRRRADRLRTTQ